MLTVIACDGCGRRFVTEDAKGVLGAIKGPCMCGGRFAAAAAPADCGRSTKEAGQRADADAPAG